MRAAAQQRAPRARPRSRGRREPSPPRALSRSLPSPLFTFKEILQRPLEIAQAWRREVAGPLQLLERPVARGASESARRSPRPPANDTSMLARVAAAHSSFRRKGTPTRTKERTRMRVRDETSGARLEVPDGHPLVELLEGCRVRRLEPDRHLELGPREEVAEAQDRVAREGGVALDDDALEAAHERRDRRVVLRRDRRAVEEAARVVELHAPRRGQPLERVPDLLGDRARSASGASSVFFQRSHIVQRNGHSRFVRKIVATGAGTPRSRAAPPPRRTRRGAAGRGRSSRGLEPR